MASSLLGYREDLIQSSILENIFALSCARNILGYLGQPFLVSKCLSQVSHQMRHLVNRQIYHLLFRVAQTSLLKPFQIYSSLRTLVIHQYHSTTDQVQIDLPRLFQLTLIGSSSTPFCLLLGSNQTPSMLSRLKLILPSVQLVCSESVQNSLCQMEIMASTFESLLLIHHQFPKLKTLLVHPSQHPPTQLAQTIFQSMFPSIKRCYLLGIGLLPESPNLWSSYIQQWSVLEAVVCNFVPFCWTWFATNVRILNWYGVTDNFLRPFQQQQQHPLVFASLESLTLNGTFQYVVLQTLSTPSLQALQLQTTQHHVCVQIAPCVSSHMENIRMIAASFAKIWVPSSPMLRLASIQHTDPSLQHTSSVDFILDGMQHLQLTGLLLPRHSFPLARPYELRILELNRCCQPLPRAAPILPSSRSIAFQLPNQARSTCLPPITFRSADLLQESWSLSSFSQLQMCHIGKSRFFHLQAEQLTLQRLTLTQSFVYQLSLHRLDRFHQFCCDQSLMIRILLHHLPSLCSVNFRGLTKLPQQISFSHLPSLQTIFAPPSWRIFFLDIATIPPNNQDSQTITDWCQKLQME